MKINLQKWFLHSWASLYFLKLNLEFVFKKKKLFLLMICELHIKTRIKKKVENLILKLHLISNLMFYLDKSWSWKKSFSHYIFICNHELARWNKLVISCGALKQNYAVENQALSINKTRLGKIISLLTVCRESSTFSLE